MLTILQHQKVHTKQVPQARAMLQQAYAQLMACRSPRVFAQQLLQLCQIPYVGEGDERIRLVRSDAVVELRNADVGLDKWLQPIELHGAKAFSRLGFARLFGSAVHEDSVIADPEPASQLGGGGGSDGVKLGIAAIAQGFPLLEPTAPTQPEAVKGLPANPPVQSPTYTAEQEQQRLLVEIIKLREQLQRSAAAEQENQRLYAEISKLSDELNRRKSYRAVADASTQTDNVPEDEAESKVATTKAATEQAPEIVFPVTDSMLSYGLWQRQNESSDYGRSGYDNDDLGVGYPNAFSAWD